MKERLLAHIRHSLEEKYQAAKANFDSIRESLTSESKSTAGDKHETGRAMVQMELEQAGKIIRECEEMMHLFQKITPAAHKTIGPGSLIHTDSGTFFISVPLGKIVLDNNDVFCIGTQAPLYQHFSGKKAGDRVAFGTQNYLIIGVE